MYIRRKDINEDGEVFWTVQLWTACCKEVYIVQETSPGTYYNVISCEPCTDGMNRQIVNAIRMWTEELTKKNRAG